MLTTVAPKQSPLIRLAFILDSIHPHRLLAATAKTSEQRVQEFALSLAIRVSNGLHKLTRTYSLPPRHDHQRFLIVCEPRSNTATKRLIGDFYDVATVFLTRIEDSQWNAVGLRYVENGEELVEAMGKLDGSELPLNGSTITTLKSKRRRAISKRRLKTSNSTPSICLFRTFPYPPPHPNITLLQPFSEARLLKQHARCYCLEDWSEVGQHPKLRDELGGCGTRVSPYLRPNIRTPVKAPDATLSSALRRSHQQGGQAHICRHYDISTALITKLEDVNWAEAAVRYAAKGGEVEEALRKLGSSEVPFDGARVTLAKVRKQRGRLKKAAAKKRLLKSAPAVHHPAVSQAGTKRKRGGEEPLKEEARSLAKRARNAAETSALAAARAEAA